MGCVVCVWGDLPIKDGPLKGQRYAGGQSQFFYVDEKERVGYCYAAYSPPWKRLRKRAAYYVQYSSQLRKSEVRKAREFLPQWTPPEAK